MQVIAIDGYTATGKGTTAQLVAERLGWIYLDTGAMYRVATYLALCDGRIDADDATKAAKIQQHHIYFCKNPDTGRQEVRVDGECRESEIRSTALGLAMKPIVTCLPLRKVMEQLQRESGVDGGLVADGRDMGTVVFPDAKWKFFLTCDLDVRTQRRYDQLISLGKVAVWEDIYKEIQQRDETDYLGIYAVNQKSPDAIVVDTTYLTIAEQVEMILERVNY